jgi:glycosyltransferase-like protein
MTERIALLTYTTRPRGGVTHTLSLGEALYANGVDVRVVTLGDPDVGFYRPVAVPTVIVPAPPKLHTLEERVFASIDALEAGLRELADGVDVFHAQDCISARAAARVRDAGAEVQVFRTVHHIDDFTTEALINCQIRAIEEPDRVFVVSEHWRDLLRTNYGREACVVPNGVDVARFANAGDVRRAELRMRAGVRDQFLFLAVGGIEPRKGSEFLIAAMGELCATLTPPPVLAVVGGHSFQDYHAYREAVLDGAAEVGLDLGSDIVLLGTVDDEELPHWYRAADALAFPSTKEGWGLAILEAQAAGLPVITSDLPVFHEFLTDRVDAVMTPVGDARALAAAMREVVQDEQLRTRLADNGQTVARRYTWAQSAARHAEIYRAALTDVAR